MFTESQIFEVKRPKRLREPPLEACGMVLVLTGVASRDASCHPFPSRCSELTGTHGAHGLCVGSRVQVNRGAGSIVD